MADVIPVVEEPKKKMGRPKQDFASKDEVGRLTSMVEQLTTLVGKALDKPAGIPITPAKMSGESSLFPVPPDYAEYVLLTLGPTVEISMVWPVGGGAPDCTLIIPKEMSNAGQAHWEMYKKDWRSQVLKPGEGISGVKQFVDRVAKNLGLKPVK